MKTVSSDSPMLSTAVFFLVAVATVAPQTDALLTASLHAKVLRLPACAEFQRQQDYLDRQCNVRPRISTPFGRISKRPALSLNAVVEKIDTGMAILLDNSQNATSTLLSTYNDELQVSAADESRETQSLLTVVAGKGAVITSASNDVRVKDVGSIAKQLEEDSLSPISELTVSQGNYAAAASTSPDEVAIERDNPKNVAKTPTVMPLPIVKHLVSRHRDKGVGAVGKVFNSICKVAAAKASQLETIESHSKSFESPKQKENNDWTSNIQSAVSDLLEQDIMRQQIETYGDGPPKLLPYHGDVLLDESLSAFNGLLNHQIRIRSSIPNSVDDKYIANLRLSVFSNFDEERQIIFRSRSVEVLNRRRRRGAIALVAEMPYSDFLKARSYNELNTRITSGYKYNAEFDQRDGPYKIVGSVECSQHEFDSTILGNSRPKGSLLYITEVAVCPEARRCGVGRMLMKGAEDVAALRGVESIYLHVDVTNHAAIAMYEEAGYGTLDKRRPVYAQFTCALNLHDGALMGRCHHLMCKHLTDQTTWYARNGRH
jgi:ribosomal protein S18 acetylase RimI-like enzyme